MAIGLEDGKVYNHFITESSIVVFCKVKDDEDHRLGGISGNILKRKGKHFNALLRQFMGIEGRESVI